MFFSLSFLLHLVGVIIACIVAFALCVGAKIWYDFAYLPSQRLLAAQAQAEREANAQMAAQVAANPMVKMDLEMDKNAGL